MGFFSDVMRMISTISIPARRGRIGELDWALGDSGRLIISGTGELAAANRLQLAHVREQTQKLVIEHGVTAIGDEAFTGFRNLTSVEISESVTTVGEKIFSGCTSLKEIHYPARRRGFRKKLSEGNSAKMIPYKTAPSTDKSATQTAGKSAVQPASKPKAAKKPRAVSKTKTQSASKPTTAAKPKKTKPADENLRLTVEGMILTVGGVRVMKKFPWENLLDVDVRTIQKIVVEDGVEEISADALTDFPRLERVVIPESVSTVGDFAFNTCFCGNQTVNGGKNVFWSLDDGILLIKKNPAAKPESDFSTGYESWKAVEKNITGVKIERGVVPSKRFFDWLSKMSNDVSVQIA